MLEGLLQGLRRPTIWAVGRPWALVHPDELTPAELLALVQLERRRARCHVPGATRLGGLRAVAAQCVTAVLELVLPDQALPGRARQRAELYRACQRHWLREQPPRRHQDDPDDGQALAQALVQLSRTYHVAPTAWLHCPLWLLRAYLPPADPRQPPLSGPQALAAIGLPPLEAD